MEGPKRERVPAFFWLPWWSKAHNLFWFLQFMHLFWAVLGLRCCAWAFSSFGGSGLLFLVVHELIIVVVSLGVEHGLEGMAP